ncbi:MAG: DUF1207 domain-containing protein [Bacteroidetes bacterium]|nr:DUF1207 domain-containing protein [Bacteroidota bacterium]
MKVFIVLFCLAAFPAALFSQSSGDVSGGQGRLLFPPLIAHHVEPRVGMSRLVEEERLRLDIGNSIDLLHFEGVREGDRGAVGADFFTWTSLRQEAAFHFPVDAVDYLFGVNASYRHDLDETSSVSARLRLSHISAHLVDGSYDKTTAAWRDADPPQVYSREFVDLVLAYDYSGMLRVYAGAQYIYHIDPAELGKYAMQAGVEAVWRDAPFDGVHLYCAYDLRILDNGAMRSAHGLQIGAKIGTWRGSGVNLFLAYYHGPSQHGEFYDRMWSYWGPGLNFDF